MHPQNCCVWNHTILQLYWKAQSLLQQCGFVPGSVNECVLVKLIHCLLQRRYSSNGQVNIQNRREWSTDRPNTKDKITEIIRLGVSELYRQELRTVFNNFFNNYETYLTDEWDFLQHLTYQAIKDIIYIFSIDAIKCSTFHWTHCISSLNWVKLYVIIHECVVN
jgi:hypothetical protein